MERRNFIKQLCKASIACAAPTSIVALQSCSTYGSKNDVDSTSSDITELIIDLNKTEFSRLKTIGQSMVTGSIDFDKSGLLLYRESQNNLIVFSRRCPHAGTSINGFNNGSAACPSHGAKFKTDGTPVTGGPTNASLKQYTVDLNGSIATIFK